MASAFVLLAKIIGLTNAGIFAGEHSVKQSRGRDCRD